MNLIHLEKISINPQHIAIIDWGDDETHKETMPGGATVLSNPNAGVDAPKVAVIRFAVQHGDVPLSLVIDRASDDFKRIKEAFGRR